MNEAHQRPGYHPSLPVLIQEWLKRSGGAPTAPGDLVRIAEEIGVADDLVNGPTWFSRSISMSHLLRRVLGTKFYGHRLLADSGRKRRLYWLEPIDAAA